jgi:hypothetical protein
MMDDIVERLRDFCIWNNNHSHYDPVPVCQEAAAEIVRLRERIAMFENAKVSIDVDSQTDGDGHRVFGRVVDWQPEDYEAGGAGKPIGIRLLCEYESDNFDMIRGLTVQS